MASLPICLDQDHIVFLSFRKVFIFGTAFLARILGEIWQFEGKMAKKHQILVPYLY